MLISLLNHIEKKIKYIFFIVFFFIILIQNFVIGEEIWVRLYKDGIGKYKAGLYIEALSDLQRAVYYKDNLPYAHKYSGLILLQQGQLSQAILSLEKSLFYKKNQFDILLTIGNLYVYEYSLSKAKRYYLSALKLAPDNIEVLYALVKWHALSQDIIGLTHYKEKINKISGIEPENLTIEAKLAIKKRHNKTAYNKIQQALAKNPIYLPAYQALVQLYRIHNRKDLAILGCLEIVNFDPDNYFANISLANLFFEMKNFKQAKFYFIKTIKLNPKQEDNWIRLIDLLQEMRAYKERDFWINKAHIYGLFF